MYYIYRITNLINGKTYIGQHKYKKLNDDYMGSGVYLKRAQKKYGIENFKKEILVFNISKKEHIDLLERAFIASERENIGIENCYNITDGGDGGSNKGREFSAEWRKKIAEAHKGRAAWNKGKKMSEKTKKNMSLAKTGKNNPRYGKHPSEETREKLRKAAKNRKPISEETRKKMSEAQKRKHLELVNGKKFTNII